MRTILSVLLLTGVLQLSAQRECSTQQYIESIKASTSAAKTIADAEIFLAQSKKNKAVSKTMADDVVVRIPVVIHVLYNNAAQNVSDEQIKTQIEALNRDFRKRNSDTVNIPQRFKQFAADVQIEFALATADPKGRATSGVIRKQTGVKEWKMDDKIKFSAQGGDDAWDSKSYLNIWVGNMMGLLGYSSPVGGPAEKDGVVIAPSAFGTINTSGSFNLGRTAVHEVGHWLGLKHLWGDTYCGDDSVDDTPKQGGFTSGCPNAFRSSSCDNSTLGDMYMNYMDFTNDGCINLFTHGQKARMRSLFGDGGPRVSLLYSKGLHKPWVEEAPLPEPVTGKDDPTTAVMQLKLYPNPVSGSEIVLDFDYDATWVGKEVSIVSMNGNAVQKIKITAKTQRISLASLKAGIYFIQGWNEGKKLQQKFVRL